LADVTFEAKRPGQGRGESGLLGGLRADSVIEVGGLDVNPQLVRHRDEQMEESRGVGPT
jgi:hypothetical protein